LVGRQVIRLYQGRQPPRKHILSPAQLQKRHFLGTLDPPPALGMARFFHLSQRYSL